MGYQWKSFSKGLGVFGGFVLVFFWGLVFWGGFGEGGGCEGGGCQRKIWKQGRGGEEGGGRRW